MYELPFSSFTLCGFRSRSRFQQCLSIHFMSLICGGRQWSIVCKIIHPRQLNNGTKPIQLNWKWDNTGKNSNSVVHECSHLHICYQLFHIFMTSAYSRHWPFRIALDQIIISIFKMKIIFLFLVEKQFFLSKIQNQFIANPISYFSQVTIFSANEPYEFSFKIYFLYLFFVYLIAQTFSEINFSCSFRSRIHRFYYRR